MAQYSTPKFDVQGHRGARGLMPENTIPCFYWRWILVLQPLNLI